MAGENKGGDSYRCQTYSSRTCHPDAPAGGGGPGGFAQTGALGLEHDGAHAIPHPASPHARQLTASDIAGAGQARPGSGELRRNTSGGRREVPVLRLGNQGEEVAKLQALLNVRLVPSPGLSGGRYDAATEQAVRQLQQAKSIRVDGIAGKDTWYHLLVGGELKLAVAGSAPTPRAPAIAAPPTPPPVPKPAEEAVLTWPLEKKFTEVLTLTGSKLPGDVQKEFMMLLSPESLAMIAGTFVLLAASHAFGIGEVIDIVLLITGAYFLGRQVFEVAGDLNDFLVLTCNASDRKELDQAADHLSRVIAVIGVAAFIALLSRVKLRKGGGKAGGGVAAAEEAEAAGAGRRSSGSKGEEPPPAHNQQPKPQENGASAPTSKEPANTCGSQCSKAGEPVSMVSGEEMLERVDFTWDGPLPLVWRRFYRSGQCDQDLQLGHGWLSPLDEWLEVGERVSYHNADGQRINLPLPEVGSYSVNLPEQIRLYRDAKRFRLVDRSGLERVFLGASGRCLLASWNNREGQSLQIHRGDHGDIDRISAGSHRHLLLERQGRHIVAIRRARRNGTAYEPVSDPLVRYQYSEEGDLIATLDRLEQGERYGYRNHLLISRKLASAFLFQFEWDGETPKARCIRSYGENGIYDYRFEWLP
ncbi:MAG: peptidoglycan-binding protein, partial [Methylococcaceae bacterium]|nr:peptidoglycan-binding protein [Methylococcaceae bacterium]